MSDHIKTLGKEGLPLVVTRYHINYPSLRLKIAVLADIHDRPIVKAMERVKAEKPDMILVPGDIFTGHMTKDAWDADDRSWTDELGIAHEKKAWKEPVNAVRVLKELCSSAPTYFSLGNHENRWQEADIRFVESLGVRVLNNRYERISDDLLIGGSSFHRLYGIDQAENAGKSFTWLPAFEAEQGYKILMMHEPQLWPANISHTNIDLTISGHCHGGQWRFFGRGVFAPGQGFFPKYSKGMYENGRLLVSAGLANTGRVPRFFNPTELVILNIGG